MITLYVHPQLCVAGNAVTVPPVPNVPLNIIASLAANEALIELLTNVYTALPVVGFVAVDVIPDASEMTSVTVFAVVADPAAVA